MYWSTSIKSFKEQPRPTSPYFDGAYDFMKRWIEGQEDFILHTSGSTGAPKPISVNRTQLAASARMTGKALHLGAGTRALVCLNVSYVAGLMMLVRGMELEWELSVVEPSSNPIASLEIANEFDFVAMVPLQLAEILENPLTEKQVDRLGKILLGGAPVNVRLKRRIAKLEIPVYQSYGMTETVSHVALRKLNGSDADENYTFLPDIIFGKDNRGCLFVSGAVSNHEIVQTNDLVEISGNTFKWLGRADNIINSGGVKISPDKVDDAVAELFYDLELTNQFFSWFEPDEKLGQKLILIVEGFMKSASEKDILDEIRTRLSAYETPKRIYFVDQFLKTPTDKVDKHGTVQQLFES